MSADETAPADTTEAVLPDHEQTAPSEIDWAELWAEFGFDTPDTDGNEYVSRTQLEAAIDASDQNIVGDARGIITDAVDDGVLHKLTASGTHGEALTRGFVLDGGSA